MQHCLLEVGSEFLELIDVEGLDVIVVLEVGVSLHEVGVEGEELRRLHIKESLNSSSQVRNRGKGRPDRHARLLEHELVLLQGIVVLLDLVMYDKWPSDDFPTIVHTKRLVSFGVAEQNAPHPVDNWRGKQHSLLASFLFLEHLKI